MNIGLTFQYRPLDSLPESQAIRLLKLLPAKSSSEPLRCIIFHSSWSNNPGYEALSYVWGSEENRPSLFVSYSTDLSAESGGQNAEGGGVGGGQPPTLNVTQNLDAALRHIRDKESERIMWIDAICINQTDNDEKGRQVQQMRDIYLQSQNVVLWLGIGGTSKTAIDFLRGLPLQPDGSVSYTTNRNDDRLWGACDDIFINRPYWRRSWILQEVLHNRAVTIYIGDNRLSIEELFELFHKYWFVRMTLSSISNVIPALESQSSVTKKSLAYDQWFRSLGASDAVPDSIVELRGRYKDPSFQEPRLPSLLWTFRDQLAKEPKDKIYSLLGMCKKEYKIRIEYDDSVFTKRDLYMSVARQMLTKVLNILMWVESPHRDVRSGLGGKELPSWVPDFTLEPYLAARCLYKYLPSFNAAKDFPGGIKKQLSTTPTNDEGIFTVAGIYVGCVTQTHCTNLTQKWTDDDAYKDFDQVKLFQYTQGRQLLTAKDQLGLDSVTVPSKASEMTFKNSSWGPNKAEIGDIIIVAAGSNIPLVLRRFKNQYLFVGGCWLVESEIEDLTKLNEGGMQQGFSEIMYGSIIGQIGTHYMVEEFDLF